MLSPDRILGFVTDHGRFKAYQINLLNNQVVVVEIAEKLLVGTDKDSLRLVEGLRELTKKKNESVNSERAVWKK